MLACYRNATSTMAVTLLAMLGTTSTTASADEPSPDPPPTVAPPGTGTTGTATADTATAGTATAGKTQPGSAGAPADRSAVARPMMSKATCEAELKKDKHWTAQLVNDLLELTGLPRTETTDEQDYRAPAHARKRCTEELKRDPVWRDKIRKEYLIKKVHAAGRAFFRADVHTEDAKLMLNNKKHVVMAYAALWALLVLVVVLMWMKQRKLGVEITRLEAELNAAIDEDK